MVRVGGKECYVNDRIHEILTVEERYWWSTPWESLVSISLKKSEMS